MSSQPAPLPLRVLLVEDEEPARAVMREYLERLEEVEIVGECANGFEAVKEVSRLDPNLVLLDIQMPKLNGFEVLELLDRKPAVIFVTAYDEFALQAFQVHAVDYLLKPVESDRLLEALQRARSRIASGQTAPPAALIESGGSVDKHLDRVLVREKSQIHVIPADAIDYIEAQDDYVAISAQGQIHRKQDKLSRLEHALDPERFVRIHRSYLLNLDRLARVELYAKDSRIAILVDDRKLPVSRSGYARLKQRL